jgi:hypothetical protein
VPKYVSLFNFKGEALKAMMDNPADRAAAVRDLAESAGGALDSYYLTFGQYDGLAIWEVPDSASAAAFRTDRGRERRASHSGRQRCSHHRSQPQRGRQLSVDSRSAAE